MIIVDSFTVPKALEDQGYTGTSVAQQLIDRVEFIHSTAKTRVERQQIGPRKPVRLAIQSAGAAVRADDSDNRLDVA